MSGYLHRLASSALRPGGAIHPMMTPIFSASESGSAAETASQQTVGTRVSHRAMPLGEERGSVVPVPLEPLTTPPSAQQMGESLEPSQPTPSVEIPQPLVRFSPESSGESGSRAATDSALPEDSHLRLPSDVSRFQDNVQLQKDSQQPDGGRPREIAPRSFVSMNLGDAIEALMGRDRPAGQTEPTHSQTLSSVVRVSNTKAEVLALRSDERNGAEDGERGSADLDSAGSIDRYVPLLPEKSDLWEKTVSASEAAKRTDAPLATPALPSQARQADRTLPSRAAMPQREPDEIRIHIGRIEVTAAPPAPAPARVAPARKTLSLDDYLKRRSGRP